MGPPRRKLAMLDAAAQLRDLQVPPANRLKKLKGDRQGQYSIRINDQNRICFTWKMEMRSMSRSAIITERTK
jgi:proteic killer suppression protein